MLGNVGQEADVEGTAVTSVHQDNSKRSCVARVEMLNKSRKEKEKKKKKDKRKKKMENGPICGYLINRC